MMHMSRRRFLFFAFEFAFYSQDFDYIAKLHSDKLLLSHKLIKFGVVGDCTGSHFKLVIHINRKK